MEKQVTPSRFVERVRFYGASIVLVAAAVVLIYTGFMKLFDHTAFRSLLISHGLVPEPLVASTAWGVILIELAAGAGAIWLIAGERRVRLASTILSSIFFVFTAYAGAMVLFPPPAPTSCGCAGASPANDQPANWRVIAGRDSAAATLLLLMIPAASQTRAQRSPR